MDPFRSRELPSYPAIVLAEIRLAVFQDYLVNLSNNLRGYCFGSSRTGRNTVEKITTFLTGNHGQILNKTKDL
jgi:hypothetical protein